MFPLNDGDIFYEVNDGEIIKINGMNVCQYNGEIYPYTRVEDTDVLVNSSTTFLSFIHTLIEALKTINLNPNLDIINAYMGKSEKIIILEEKGKLTIWDRNKEV